MFLLKRGLVARLCVSRIFSWEEKHFFIFSSEEKQLAELWIAASYLTLEAIAEWWPAKQGVLWKVILKFSLFLVSGQNIWKISLRNVFLAELQVQNLQLEKITSFKTIYRFKAAILTLFRMGVAKSPPTSFSPVTSGNVGIGFQNFLAFSFNYFATLL